MLYYIILHIKGWEGKDSWKVVLLRCKQMWLICILFWIINNEEWYNRKREIVYRFILSIISVENQWVD